jgi:hypothetical protein
MLMKRLEILAGLHLHRFELDCCGGAHCRAFEMLPRRFLEQEAHHCLAGASGLHEARIRIVAFRRGRSLDGHT